MRTGSILIILILLGLVTFLATDVGFSLYQPGRLASSLPACTLNIISGQVSVLKKDALSWVTAEDGMILYPGGRIKTAAGAQASITFDRGTTTKLEPGTDVIVTKIEENQETQPYLVLLKQQTGKTWNQVARTGDKIDFQIQTASANIKVHGTLFSAEVDASGKTIVQTTEGQVSVSAGGEEVQVMAGKLTEVERGAAPAAPMPIPQPRNELVITVDRPALGLVKAPDGSSVGRLPDGVEINQVWRSLVSAADEPGQTIRLREPEKGVYLLVLGSTTDGSGRISVEGFVDGKSAFTSAESYNITAANDMLIKLHYEVIDGLLEGALVLEPGALKEPAPVVPALSMSPGGGKEPAAEYANVDSQAPVEPPKDERKVRLFVFEGDNQLVQYVWLAGIVALIGIIYTIIFKNST
jgi:hypothetical protein